MYIVIYYENLYNMNQNEQIGFSNSTRFSLTCVVLLYLY